MNQLLFQKVYDELHEQLNAIFDRKTFQHQTTKDYSHLLNDVLNELSDAFRQVESWDLVDFIDVVESTRNELRTRYGTPTGSDSSTLSPRGQALERLLNYLEHIVVDVVPSIADTLLSKQFVKSLVERCKTVGCDIPDATVDLIESYSQPEEWKAEVQNWMSDLSRRVEHGLPLHEQLTRLLEFVHEQADVRVTLNSVIDRIQRELKSLQSSYDMEIAKWTAECSRIEEKNRVIAAHNQRRDELLTAAQAEYERDMRMYQQSLSEYNQRIAESGTPQSITPPSIPEPLESRVRMIESTYPLQSLIPLPPRPEPPEALTNYSELNSLLTEQIAQLSQRQTELAQVFIQQLDQLKSDSLSRAVNASIDIHTSFLDYVMSSVVRRLGRVFPRIKRVYLRDAIQPNRLYLVTYEHRGDEIVISAGDNILR